MKVRVWAALAAACLLAVWVFAPAVWPVAQNPGDRWARIGAPPPAPAADPVDLLPAFVLDGASPPPGPSGSGLQVLQVAPQGPVSRVRQVVVVFDRPMVALTALDTMLSSVPVRCGSDIFEGRWAGTSTAVLVPRTADLAPPLASTIECVVPAGTAALDGTTLENDVRWTFETPRPRVVQTIPRDGAQGLGLDGAVRVSFDQVVAPEALAEVLSLRDDAGREVGITGVQPADHPFALVVKHEPLQPDTAYTLTIGAGLRGVQGPLAMTEPHTFGFRTFPPLVLEGFSPEGASDPVADLQLRFSTPVRHAEVASRLSIEPAPVDAWSPPDSTWESTRWGYAVRLEPRTSYTVRLAAGVTDIHGQQLPSHEWTFTTGDYEPYLRVAGGFSIYAANNPPVLPFHHFNTGTIDVRLGAIPAVGTDTAILDPGRAVRALIAHLAPDRRVPDTEPNVVGVDALDFGAHLTNGYGLVGWSVSSPDVRQGDHLDVRHGIALVTDLGATLKLTHDAADVWVTRLSDGRPVEGATVELHMPCRILACGDTKGQVEVARTDASGLVHIELPPGYGRHHDLYVIARVGDDWTVVREDWRIGLPRRRSVGHTYHPGNEDAGSAAAYGFLDRGVYRPGDTVHARTTFRKRSSAGLELPDPEVLVTWGLRNPEGDIIDKGEGTLDARGGFDLRIELPEDGPLGDYELSVGARLPDWTWRTGEDLRIPVRAYRPPAFRVQVDVPPEAVLGQELTAAADARYLFGTPLSEGDVEWRTWAEPSGFHPRGYDGWSFGQRHAWWSDEHRGGELLESVAAKLDAGRHLLRPTLPVGQWERPMRLLLEAEVTDVDRQSIAQRAEVKVHPARWYLGLRPAERLPSAGEPLSVSVVALGLDGEPRPAEATVRVTRGYISRVREEGLDGRWHWRNQGVEEPVLERALRLGARASEVVFTPEAAGRYTIQVEGTDEAGNPVHTSDVVYATGADEVTWELSDDERLELVPDKARYAPGETARILVKAPRSGLSALVTAERETIVFREVVQLEGTASVVEVPITRDHLPNLFVSVVAVMGAGPQDAPDKGRPQVRMGLVELAVDTSAEHLAVTVDTDQEEYRPRDRVEAVVRVQQEGRPVANAGVTLFAVDEAVLQLTKYRTPDAHETFYIHHGHGTATSDTRLVALDRAPWLTKGAPRGGGGGVADAEGFDLRSQFLTTIAWEPDLRTGPDGTVRASFDLPDNLTTFRVMAVVDSGASAFGAGDREIRVSRPLIARPALPRFLRAGDTAFAGVVLHNNADASMSVNVEASATGPVNLVDGAATVRVPAHGAVEVPFRLEGTGAGEAVFDFVAKAGGEHDAVRQAIPVRRDLTFETVASTGATTDTAYERIARPDGVVDGFGGLDVDVASTVLVGADAGLDYLRDYPHGGVEQTTSRALASLEAVELARAGVLDVDAAALEAQVQGVLRELREFDHPTGGVTQWKGGGRPTAIGTAYVVDLLGRAAARGYSVDPALVARHVGFLRKVLNGAHLDTPRLGLDDASRNRLELTTQAYVLVALARAGEGDAGHANALYTRRDELTAFGQASLLEAILRTTGADHRTRELERALLGRVVVDAAAASIREDGAWYWSWLWLSDDLATAATLEALLRSDPAHPMAHRLARHLQSARRQGRWHDTRATAAVLAALASYARLHEGGDEPLRARVALAGREIVRSQLPRPGTMGVDLPLSDVVDGDLVFESLNGRQLYFDARLRYVPVEAPARDHGFRMLRSYEVLEGGGPDGEIRSGTLVRVTLQVVTPERRHAVAVIDPLPAGFEPVETMFDTTSRAPRADGGASLERIVGGSWAFDHHEVRDHEVRLYASDMNPGAFYWNYVVRATTPGDFEHPAATVSQMYEPEVFGRTAAGRVVVGHDATAR